GFLILRRVANPFDPIPRHIGASEKRSFKHGSQSKPIASERRGKETTAQRTSIVIIIGAGFFLLRKTPVGKTGNREHSDDQPHHVRAGHRQRLRCHHRIVLSKSFGRSSSPWGLG